MAAVNAPLGQLVELLGVVDALVLVDKRGGTAVYVPYPSRLKPHSAIAEEIGLEAAKKLAGVYPGSHLMVPMGAAHLRRQRDLAVLTAARDTPVARVARRFKTTERHVYRILERGLEGLPDVPGSSESQGDLFGENA